MKDKDEIINEMSEFFAKSSVLIAYLDNKIDTIKDILNNKEVKSKMDEETYNDLLSVVDEPIDDWLEKMDGERVSEQDNKEDK